jgi:ABC-type thiamine transport system ATPase subunit
VRILTTLALPDAGQAWVAGIDVLAHPAAARRQIGVAAQDATLDGLLTGRQNLALVGELSGMRAGQARIRGAELLELFELTEAADRMVKGYSGGMRRRLDLAASLLMRPPVLFLDEPTTGLDPVSRQRVWEVIRKLTGSGVTLLLTTQYLDEADARPSLDDVFFALTASTSWASWAIVHGDRLLMSSRYWRRTRRTTRKRAARRPATFRHDLPSSMPGCTIRMAGPRPWSAARTLVPSAEVVVITARLPSPQRTGQSSSRRPDC